MLILNELLLGFQSYLLVILTFSLFLNLHVQNDKKIN